MAKYSDTEAGKCTILKTIQVSNSKDQFQHWLVLVEDSNGNKFVIENSSTKGVSKANLKSSIKSDIKGLEVVDFKHKEITNKGQGETVV